MADRILAGGRGGMDDDEKAERERDILQHELDYRRGRRSGIFQWANTILLAIIGGVIALQRQTDGSLGVGQQLIATATVAIVAGYASLWWPRQHRTGRALHRRIDEIDAASQIIIPTYTGKVPEWIGSFYLILLLGAAALLAIWLPAS